MLIGEFILEEWEKPTLYYYTGGDILAKNIKELTTEITQPIVDELGLELVDVEFIKEGASWYLRIYIDKDGGITIEDCENVSRKVDKILDEIDPIEQGYYLEVSSPGIDRPLKKESDFTKYKGKLVEVKLYKVIEGSKIFEGELVGLIDNKIIIKEEKGKELTFDKNDVALVKLSFRL